MKTLIIVDVQNDFLPGGALEVPESDYILPVINKIQDNFNLVIATQDWHPKNHMSFASNHPGHKPFDIITYRNMNQTLWPDHCVQNTEGAELSPVLKTNKIEAIFRKGTDPGIDSYSAFYDNGHLKSTGLSGYLREKKVTELYFCGLAADICVFFSIMDALKENFKCFLISDASAPIDKQNYGKITQTLVEKGVVLTSSSAFL